MKNRFLNYITENSLPEPGSDILIAVSGGIDSMVLAHLIKDCGYSAGIAHCNFNLRGRESDDDELFVRDYAKKNGALFHSIRFNTEKYAAEKRISIQMAARDLRYEWFEKIRQEFNYQYIAVAHNLNDNAETTLINLTRGTGLAGLTGMQPITGKIFRPLLFASRREIVQYAEENNISFREDSSNASTKYVRNSIRHSVIPELEKINPSFLYSLSDTARHLTDYESIVNILTEEFIRRAIKNEGEVVRVKINEFKTVNYNSVLLLNIFGEYGLTPAMVGELIKLFGGNTGAIMKTGTHRFIKNRNELIITFLPDNSVSLRTFKNITQLKKSGIFSVNISPYSKENKFSKEKNTAYFDADVLRFPVTLRSWKQGDSFTPFGMDGTKKISDFFTDLKYSIADKEKALVLESNGLIVWIAGERIDNRFRVSDKTKRVLILNFKGNYQEP